MRTRLHVIAGDARGRNLEVPPDTRPTTGRVREALFASLGDVSGMQVLDLYSGSGAVAIEALSRGAAGAVLVERDHVAVDVCRTNLEATGFASAALVVRRDVDAFLAGPVPSEAPFDLVWCDPPYGTDPSSLDAIPQALGAPGWLAADARIVMERAVRDRSNTVDAPDGPPPSGTGPEVTWERRYGDTLVTVLRQRRRPDDEA